MRNTSLTLGEAARLAGVSKATIHRQIKSGKLSATRLDDGSYAIDPAELHRVHAFQVNGSGERLVKQSETPNGTPSETPRNTPREAELNAEVTGARALISALEKQLADIREDRDQWRDQAKATQRLLSDLRPAEEKKGFLRRLFG